MSKELVVLNDYAVAKMDTQELQEVFLENFGGENLTPQDLDKIKIPGGGGTTWEVPDITEGTIPMKEVTGVIIYKKNFNAYWPNAFDGTGEPPACYSNDTIVGVGEPGGNCKNCPLNQWGSGKGGSGKACHNKATLFILLPNSLLPITLTLPPTSMKSAKNYFMRLASGGIKYTDCLTKFRLEKDKSNGGIDYSKVAFEFGGKLDDDAKAKVDAYRQGILPSLKSADVANMNDAEDVEFDD